MCFLFADLEMIILQSFINFVLKVTEVTYSDYTKQDNYKLKKKHY